MKTMIKSLCILMLMICSCKEPAGIEPAYDTELRGGWAAAASPITPYSRYLYFEQEKLVSIPRTDFDPYVRTHAVQFTAFAPKWLELYSPLGNGNLIASYRYHILQGEHNLDTLILKKISSSAVTGNVGNLPDTLLRVE